MELKFRVFNKTKNKFYNFDKIEIIPKIQTNIIDFTTDDNAVIAIQQYTGLKDKHGKEIYEGDIVKFDDGEIAEVVFFCGAFMPKLEKGRGISIQYDANPLWQDGEVIGNIHENSELLGGKNE